MKLRIFHQLSQCAKLLHVRELFYVAQINRVLIDDNRIFSLCLNLNAVVLTESAIYLDNPLI